MEELDTFILNKNINNSIRKGMAGTILLIHSEERFTAEFVNKDGTNVTDKGFGTFIISLSDVTLN